LCASAHSLPVHRLNSFVFQHPLNACVNFVSHIVSHFQVFHLSQTLNFKKSGKVRCSNAYPFSVYIPVSVESLSTSCFLGCESLSSVTFEPGSRLRHIDEGAFSTRSSLESFCIPASLQLIHGSSLLDTSRTFVTVDDENSHFRVCEPFLLDIGGRSLKFFAAIVLLILDHFRLSHSHPLLDCNRSRKGHFPAVYHFSLFAFRRRFKFSAKSVLRCAATLRI
jgi:hypothetical protein